MLTFACIDSVNQLFLKHFQLIVIRLLGVFCQFLMTCYRTLSPIVIRVSLVCFGIGHYIVFSKLETYR